jgi:RNA polymerase sigma-70 factor (ECF subfamily)
LALVSGADDELVERARAGDPAAFEQIVAIHRQIAFRTAYLVTGNAAEAEDAVQDALIKAWRAMGRFRPGAPVRPWLLKIVVNESRNRLRAAGRRASHELRLLPEPPREGPEPGERERLLGALAALREDDRLVISCRYLLDLSEQETAAALGVRRGTVKSRLSRALARLRDELGEEGA